MDLKSEITQRRLVLKDAAERQRALLLQYETLVSKVYAKKKGHVDTKLSIEALKQACSELEDVSGASVGELNQLRSQLEIGELQTKRLEQDLEGVKQSLVIEWSKSMLPAVSALHDVLYRYMVEEVRALIEANFDQCSTFTVQLAVSNYRPIKILNTAVQGLPRYETGKEINLVVALVKEGLLKVEALLVLADRK